MPVWPTWGLCDDGVACTTDTCDTVTDCANTPTDSLCDDGIACTVDSCDAVADCLFTASDALCDDGDACSLDVCNVGAGSCDYTGTCGISGTVHYYRDDATATEPSAKTVPNVDIDTTDDGVPEQVTDGGGIYLIPDLYGSYVVATLDKYGDPRISDAHNGVSSLDASFIAQAVVQQITLLDAPGTRRGRHGERTRYLLRCGEDRAVRGTADRSLRRCRTPPGRTGCSIAVIATTERRTTIASIPVYDHDPLSGPVTDDFYAILYGDCHGQLAGSGQEHVRDG